MPTGEVAWYVTGRFYGQPDPAEPKKTIALDVGFFLHLQGIEGDFFEGEPSEATAHFTFCADPFVQRSYDNGGLPYSLSERGDFGLFYKDPPGSSWDDPSSFADGYRIATFRRVSVVAGVSLVEPMPDVSAALNVFTAELIWSQPFHFHGRVYDLGESIKSITQWGTAVTEPIRNVPPPYSSVVPFVGSAIFVG